MTEGNTRYESFYGHFVTGIFLIFLSIWWMYNLFSNFFRAKIHRHEFRCRLWFPARKYPIETFCKIVLAFTMVISEIVLHYSIRSQEHIVHLNTLYIGYLLSAVIELLLYYGVSLPLDLDYLTTCATYVLFSSSFSTHCSVQSTDVELCTNTFLSRMLLVASATVVAQLLNRSNVTVGLAFPVINTVLGASLCFEALLFYSPFKGVKPLLFITDESEKALTIIADYLIGWSSFLAFVVVMCVFKFVEKTCICLKNNRKTQDNHESRVLLSDHPAVVSDDF